MIGKKSTGVIGKVYGRELLHSVVKIRTHAIVLILVILLKVPLIFFKAIFDLSK